MCNLQRKTHSMEQKTWIKSTDKPNSIILNQSGCYEFEVIEDGIAVRWRGFKPIDKPFHFTVYSGTKGPPYLFSGTSEEDICIEALGR